MVRLWGPSVRRRAEWDIGWEDLLLEESITSGVMEYEDRYRDDFRQLEDCLLVNRVDARIP